MKKNFDLFSFRSDRKDVKNSWSKECNREYQIIKSIEYRKKRDRNVEINVSEKVCYKCGINELLRH